MIKYRLRFSFRGRLETLVLPVALYLIAVERFFQE